MSELILKNIKKWYLKLFSKLKKFFSGHADEHKIIGQVLKQRGIITDQQLDNALKEQKHRFNLYGQAISLGMIIVELNYASEDQLINAINDQYQISVTSLADDIKELVINKRGALIERLPYPRVPIWLQIAIATTFIIVFTIVILNYVVLNKQKKNLYNQTVANGMVSLNYFDNNSRIPLINDDILELNTLIKNATSVEGVLYAIIIDNKQIVKAHTDYRKIGTVFEPFKGIDNKESKDNAVYFNYTMPDGEVVLNLTRSILFKEKKLGEIHVGVSINFIKQLIRKEQSSIIIITIFLVLIGILTAILLGLHFSRPISKLVAATEEISKGNYSYRLNMNRNDEFGTLATAFEYMNNELWKNYLLQKSFGKYVGSEVLEMILTNPEATWLKGNRNEAAILFLDIRGFTSFSDSREPEEVVESLNGYFEIATNIIQGYGGYVDKFIGDAVLGVFGIPVFRQNYIERTVRAAIHLQEEFVKAGENGNKLLSSVGIGIDSGVVVSGTIGSQDKMEYTVIGDCVNVASKLNEIAKAQDVIISKSIYENLGDIIETEPLEPQVIKGKPKPVEAFKILSIKETENIYFGK